jgi:four helix bundle protein
VENQKPETRNLNQTSMTNDESIKLASGSSKSFDLEERTAQFGERMILFTKSLPRDPVNVTLVTQLVRAATSIGANYAEADDAESKKDFRHKIGICRKESRECKHWLRMIAAAEPNRKEDARVLWQEAKELNLIFGAIRRKTESSDV